MFPSDKGSIHFILKQHARENVVCPSFYACFCLSTTTCYLECRSIIFATMGDIFISFCKYAASYFPFCYFLVTIIKMTGEFWAVHIYATSIYYLQLLIQSRLVVSLKAIVGDAVWFSRSCCVIRRLLV